MIKMMIGIMLAMGFSAMNGSDYESNVNNSKAYTYEITEIEGNEIHGIPLDNINEGNKGIFLYDDELDFDTNIGDVIQVVWGQQEDEFKSIELVK